MLKIALAWSLASWCVATALPTTARSAGAPRILAQDFEDVLDFLDVVDPNHSQRSLRPNVIHDGPSEASETPPEKWAPERTPEETKRLEANKLLVIGYMQARRNRVSEALETAKKAVETCPESVGALKFAATLSTQLDRREDAVAYCDRGLKVDPDDVDLLILFGLLKVEEREKDAALEGLAPQNAPDTAESGRRQDEEAALDAFERATKAMAKQGKLDERVLQIREQLLRIYGNRKDHANVARVLGALIDSIDDDAKYDFAELTRAKLRERRVRYYEELGKALKESNQLAQAIEVLQKARQTEERGEYLSFTIAESYFLMNDYAKAIDELERYWKLQLPNRAAYELLEKSLAKLHRENELLAMLEKMGSVDRHNRELRRFRGEKLIEVGKFEQAESELQNLALDDDTFPLTIRLYQKMDQPERLLDAFVKGYRLPRGDDQVDRMIVEVGKDHKIVERVLKVARKRATDKTPVQELYTVARLAEEAENVEGADEFYQKCVAVQPDTSFFLLRRVRLLQSNSKYDEAIEACRDAIKRFPDVFRFHEYLARSLAGQKKGDEAVKVIEAALERLSRPDDIVEANLALGNIYQQLRQWDKAAETYQRVIEEFPEPQYISLARYMLASVYSLQGENAKAEAELQKLIDADSQTTPTEIQAAANNDLGYLWADEGKNLEQAEKMIRYALKVKPDNSAYLDSLGWVLFKRGKHAEAVEALQKASKGDDGDDPVIWDHLGDALLQQGNAAGAGESWKKSLELYKKETRVAPPGKIEQLDKKLKHLEQRPPAPKS